MNLARVKKRKANTSRTDSTPQVTQHTPNSCTTVDSERITLYCFSMNPTIPLAMLSHDEVARIWTDDEDLSDADPMMDLAAFVAYLYADEDDVNHYDEATIRWIAETARRVNR